jgi:hypothetical protein
VAEPHGWPQGDTCGLQCLARVAADAAADHEGLPCVLHRDLLQGVQIVFEPLPFHASAARIHSRLALFQDHQGQEAAKDVAPNRLITFVVNRARLDHGLEASEQSLNQPKFFVSSLFLHNQVERLIKFVCLGTS